MKQDLYKNTIRELQSHIIQKHGSVKAFCRNTDIDYKNLCKVFQLKGQTMSIGLFIRIAKALELEGAKSFQADDYINNTTIPEYMSLPHDTIQKLILKINLEL